MNEYIQAFVTIIALVNPAICATMFAECTRTLSKEERTAAALKSTASICSILLLAAVIGISVLNIFGISLNAFSCAGGGILIWIGAGMIHAAHQEPEPHPESPSAQKTKPQASLTPLILFAASPGTITGVITVSAFHEQDLLPLASILGVLSTALLLGLILWLTAKFPRKNNQPSMAQQMITSYMGVIVVAMGVQFILSGVKAFMA